MKHQEHILAFTAEFVTNVLKLPEGVSIDTEVEDDEVDSLYTSSLPYIEFKQRYGLDLAYEGKVATHRQLLPYMVVTKLIDGKHHVLTYQRAKGVGEDRLLGKKSIGVGGHVDLADVQFDTGNTICLQSTVHASVVRELWEELTLTNAEGDEIEANGYGVFSELLDTCVGKTGYINDNSDMVGRDHLGIFGVITIPDTHDVKMRETSLVQLGWFSFDELSKDTSEFENWSKLLIEKLTLSL